MNTEHTYDIQSRLLSQTWQIGDASFTESDTYDSDDGSMASMTTASGETLTYGYDTIKRLSTVTAKTASSATIYKQTFAYKTISGSQTSTQVSSLTYSSLDDTTSYAYIYDTYGRITRETDATAAYTGYSYDTLNQLRYATMYTSSGVADYRYKYFYDNSGNLVNWYINNNDNTETYENHTYTYGNTSWADLLTAFDGYGIAYEGQTYNYSTGTVSGTAKSGNPICYYNGTRWDFTWTDGRRLASADNENAHIVYTYDLNGIRTGKTVGTKTYSYLYASGKLLQQTDGTNTWNFAYAANGNPFSMTYNGTTYYYITNQMGDVMYLVNASGTRVATYTYDPYGKVLTATGTMASTNPLRYRGYYYDTETGFYYLQSRYYDPAICRFINADSYASTGQGLLGNNMFAYCSNNSVNKIDCFGMWAVSLSLGLDFTAFFFGVSISIGIAFDDDDNVAIQWSYSTPNYLNDDQTYNVGLLDVGLAGSLQVTDDDTVYDLEGSGSYAGFSVGSGLYGGVEMVYSGVEAMDENDTNTLPNGIQLTLGYGVGVDTHFRQTQTRTLWIIN